MSPHHNNEMLWRCGVVVLYYSVFILTFATRFENDMKENKPYPHITEEDGSCLSASDPAVALTSPEVQALPQDLDHAHIVNGVLQVTPDIEEEIAEVERGETVSMSEFRNTFSRWL